MWYILFALLFGFLYAAIPFTCIKTVNQKKMLMKNIFKRILSMGLRKSKRYKAKDNVFVKLENSFQKNQIDDISMRGLSFYYVENGYAVGKGSRYLKLQAGESHTINLIRFTVASDTNVGESTLPNNRIRRLSLHFERLTFRQKRQIKNLIKLHSIETSLRIKNESGRSIFRNETDKRSLLHPPHKTPGP